MVTFSNKDEPLVGLGGNVIVLVGIDGPEPPMKIQRTMETQVSDMINGAFDHSFQRDSVALTVQEHPTKEQRQVLGPGVLHVQQYDIDTGLENVPPKTVNAIHNDIVEHLQEVGFNITDTMTKVT